ncbi:MAG: hypothetical protein IT373_20350 [Polyangiaceae bacterium]|nr:hypothetical protein [Polyangiaceae bacterium]
MLDGDEAAVRAVLYEGDAESGGDRVEVHLGEANLATAALVVGGVAAATGLTLWLTAPRAPASVEPAEKREQAGAVAVGVALGGAPGLVVRGALW